MIHLKYFENISYPYGAGEDNRKSIVSFDFDGVLHSSVLPGTIHPICAHEPHKWKPRYDVFDIIEEESETSQIVIITARHKSDKDILWEFIREFGLPIDEIYCTANLPKYPLLMELGAKRHYDDNPKMALPLKNFNIDFVLSTPPYMSEREIDELRMTKKVMW